MIKKKRSISPEMMVKGAAALAEWRKKKAAAKDKGGKALAKWEEEERIKKAQRKMTPIMAIKAFCNECVGGIRSDITNCVAPKCSLHLYRPYQDGDTE
jgi:hypothetical protein